MASLDLSRSLYERVGGKPAVAAAVALFYNKIVKDPLLIPFFDGIDLARQRGKQVVFLTAVFGGNIRVRTCGVLTLAWPSAG